MPPSAIPERWPQLMDAQKEISVLDQFKQLNNDFPSGDIKKSESPDFIIESTDQIIRPGNYRGLSRFSCRKIKASATIRRIHLSLRTNLFRKYSHLLISHFQLVFGLINTHQLKRPKKDS